MKAIQFSRFGGPEVLDYVDVPRPIPHLDEILIEVSAAGVNFPDIRERMGVYQRAETTSAARGVTARFGIAGGKAVVVEVGEKCDHSLMGKKVVALLSAGGGYAQFVIAPSNLIVILPDSAGR